MMNLIHYASEPVTSIQSGKQTKIYAMKPSGFWVSVEDGTGWKDWCEAEEWNLGGLACAHEVRLNPSANILHIQDCAGIDRLGETYPHPEKNYDCGLNWAAIAEQYQGLIIAPYQWERRLSMEANWYYSWDCSSGCIWDAEAIESVTLIETAS